MNSFLAKGRDHAMKALGLEPEPSLLQKAAPWAAGLGAAGLSYGLMRKFTPSAAKGLRALQTHAKDMPLTIATREASPWIQRLRSTIFGTRTVNRGTEGIKGVVLQHSGAPSRGMGDININAGELANAMGNKSNFDAVMRRGIGAGPGLEGALPDTANLGEVLKKVRHPEQLHALYPEGFFIKDPDGSMGRGIFTSLDQEGISGVLQHPDRFIIQRKLPIEREYRVHTLNNEPYASTHRWIPNETLRGMWNKVMGGGGGAFLPVTGGERQGLEDFVRRATQHLQGAEGQTLHELGHDLHAAYDVARLPDGTFKLIEANTTPGTFMNPAVNQRFQRALTGRWSRPVAGATALGAAGAAGLTTDAATG